MKSRSISGLLPLALALYPCAAHAGGASADISDSANDRIETVTVTAHRLPTSASTLPVITRELQDGPAVGPDALRDLPSFAISQAGALGTLTQVRVRGAEADHLLVLIDGVDLMDPSTDAGFNFANLNLAGIDRLEYLPGAQSAIWGSDAVAGVLQLSTRPSADRRHLAVEAGSFASRAVRLQAAEVGDQHYYNFSLADFTTDGTNISRTGSGKDGYDNRSALLSGGLDRERWALRGVLRGVRTRSDFDPVSFVTGLPEDGDRQNRHDETLALLGLDLNGEPGWQQRLTLSWFDTSNRTLTDGRRTATVDGERVKLSSVTRLPLAANQHVELLAEHQRERFEQRGEPSPFGDPNQSQRLRTSSVGAEYVIAPTERLRLSASARHDHNSAFENSRSVRLAASQEFGAATRVWLAAGTGVKHPSFIERFGFTPDRFLGNPDLEAEQNRHLSAGVQTRAGDWQLATTLFRDRLEDEINGFFFDPNAGGFTSINREGTSKRQGIELSAARSFGNTGLSAGASYLDAEEPDGQREVRRPRWLGYVRVNHAMERADLSVDVFQVNEQIDLNFASFPATRVKLDRYTLVNAQLRLPVTARTEISVRGSNLLDERYEDILGYRAPGRAYYLQLGIDL
ncbi:MAG: TonB-dependent receptor plug domain-containing protein [Pseudomonadales bacterium]